MPAIIPAVVAVAGAAMGANASKKAAKTQADAADRATEIQREQFERQIELQEPWRQTGGLGLNALSYGMGLSPTGTFRPGATGASEAQQVETREQIRARLAPQFTRAGTAAIATGAGDWAEQQMDFLRNGGQPAGAQQQGVGGPDNVALDAAVQAEMDRMQQERGTSDAAALTAAQGDPKYGNLLRDFSRADFEADPGYQFRMEEGAKAVTRGAGAGYGIGSGRYLKDLERFGQGLGAQEYGAAFNRYKSNQGDRFNRLAAVAGIGQTATNQVSNAAGAYGSAVGSNIIGAGNARAAGQVGGANAITGAAGQGYSMYRDQQMVNALQRTPGYGTQGMNQHFFGFGTGGD